MTDEEIIIHVNPNVHPTLYKQIKQAMADFDCKTYPELLVLMFDRASLRRRVSKDFTDTLRILGIISEEDSR